MPLNQTRATASLPQPRFEDGRPMTIAGLREHYTRASLDDIPALWQRLVASGFPGRIGPVDHAVVFPTADGCDYIAGYEVAGSAEPPKGFARVEIPPRRYAVFTHDGHVSTMRNTCASILGTWLPASGLQIAGTTDADAFFLERYGEGFDPRTGLGDMQIWVPVTEVRG